MRRLLYGLTAVAVLLPFGLLAPSTSRPPASGFDADRLAGEIPPDMLGAYLDAADTFEIDWALLAAIGKLECDHGRSQLPGCWPPGTINHAGARGPMQFLGSTWRTTAGQFDLEVAGPPAPDGHGYATDGDGDGIADPWSTHDAVHAAARYLVDLGARDDPRRAAKHYNAGPANPNPAAGEGYATRTIELAASYRQLAGTSGPGTPAEPAPAGAGTGGCTIADPTGTGGCVTPRTAHLVSQIRQAFGTVPIWCWAPRPANPTSDHPRGRACDITYGAIGRFPTTSERAEGWAMADWLTANAQPLGVAYVIWDGLIWSPISGWGPYSGGGIYNPADPTGGHYDHVHVSVKPST
jgi:hypothetical protein